MAPTQQAVSLVRLRGAERSRACLGSDASALPVSQTPVGRLSSQPECRIHHSKCRFCLIPLAARRARLGAKIARVNLQNTFAAFTPSWMMMKTIHGFRCFRDRASPGFTPVLLSSPDADCVAAKLLSVDVHDADGWEPLSLPEFERRQMLSVAWSFRGNSTTGSRLASSNSG